MLTDLEKKWLDYARDVLGKKPETCCIDTDRPFDGHIRRWPGYLGPRYEQGRILLVGTIHNERQLFTPAIVDLEEEALSWSRQTKPNPERDARYLNRLRFAYEQSAPQWGHPVWSTFHDWLKRLGRTLEDAAFTNLAKCYWPPAPFGGSCQRFVEECTKRHPLKRLYELLQPTYMFVASSNDHTRSLVNALDDGRCKIWQYDNRTGKRDGMCIKVWRNEVR